MLKSLLFALLKESNFKISKRKLLKLYLKYDNM